MRRSIIYSSTDGFLVMLVVMVEGQLALNMTKTGDRQMLMTGDMQDGTTECLPLHRE